MLHSFLILPFLVVSSLHQVTAQNLQPRDTTSSKIEGIVQFLRRLVHGREIVTCNPDDIYTLMGSPWGKTACSVLFSSPNATVITSVTSTIWTTEVTATIESTRFRRIEVTADTTVTVTQTNAAMQKRNALPAPEPTKPARLRRATNVQAAVAALQEWEAGNIDPSALLQWAPAVESACGCLDSGPLFTSTVTEVVDTITITRNAYIYNFTNENITTAVETTTNTVTVTEMPVMLPVSSSSALDPTITTGPIKFRSVCTADGSDEMQEILAYPMLYTFKSFCGYAFQNEVAFNVSSLATEDDCQAACAQANTNFGGPLCKAISWKGSCNLYIDGLSSDLYASPGSNAAILVSAYPLQSPSNFTTTTGSPEQTSVALAPITGGNFTYQTPPASLVLPGDLSTITFSSCSGSTWTTGNVIRWTSSCSANASWFGDIIASTTAVYTTTLSVGGQSGLAWSGGGEQSLTAEASTIQTDVSGSEFSTVVSYQTAGEWQIGWATGGEVTITTVIPDSTVVYVSTIPTPSAWSSEWSDGGEISLSEATTPLASTTDSPIFSIFSAWNASMEGRSEVPVSDSSETTITTVISNSTVVYVSTLQAGSAWSSEWSDGGELTLSEASPTAPSVIEIPSELSWSVPTGGYNSSAEETGDRSPLPTERASSTNSAADSNGELWSYSTVVSTGGADRDAFESSVIVTVVVDTVSSLPTHQSLTDSLPIPEETSSMQPTNETSTTIRVVTLVVPADTPSTTTDDSQGGTFTQVTYWNGSLTLLPDNSSTIQAPPETTESVSPASEISSAVAALLNQSSTTIVYWNDSLTGSPSSVPTTEVPSNDTEASSTISDVPASPVESASETSITATYWNDTTSVPSTDNSTSQTPTNETAVPSTTSDITSGIFTLVTNWNESTSVPAYNASTTPSPANDTEVPSTTSEVSAASFTPGTYWNESSTIPPDNSSTTELPLNSTGSSSTTSDIPFSIPFEDRPPGSDIEPSATAPYQNASQVIVTVTVTESCPICLTTTLFPFESLFSPTLTLEEPTSSEFPTSTPPSNSTIPSPPSRPRSPNTPATDDEIAAACAYTGNTIYNSGFEHTFLASSIPVPQNFGWATNDARAVQFLSSTEPDQLTEGGSWVVQFATSRASAVGTLWQPLTLCPGVEYLIGGSARQNATADGCKARFGVGGVPVGTIEPGESWTNDVVNRTVYTVGALAANASVNLEITMQCDGIGEGGIGVMELDEISLTRVS